MLAKGGNAVDAAIASAIAITVVEPTMNGIGSDAFCILWDGTKLVGLNASGHSPELMTPDKYEGQAKIADTGWGCVSTPGAVSLWMTLHARYGKLPFADLFEPAIKYAHDGFRVSYMVARQWDAAIARLKGQDAWVKAFLPNGRAPLPGEVWKFPDQAKTLRMIAESKGEAFYRGELAEAMDKYAKETGGALRRNDLESHSAGLGRSDRPHLSRHDAARDPAERPGHRRLHGARHPRELRCRRARPDGPEMAHLRIEAMKLAFADIYRYVADPRFMEVTPRQMLDKGYLKSRAKLIDPKKAQGFRPGRAEGRRHDLSRHRRRIRHDGVADPVELHRLRLGHRRARHRHRPAQPRERLRDHQGPSQPGRAEEAAVPHHHPRLHHQGRQAGRDLRPDGRRDAAAGPHAGLLAHRRLRPEPAGRDRCAALAGARERRHGVDGGPHSRPTPRPASRSRGHKLTRTQWPSFAFGSSQIIWKFPEGGPYLGASESRRDGAAVGF